MKNIVAAIILAVAFASSGQAAFAAYYWTVVRVVDEAGNQTAYYTEPSTGANEYTYFDMEGDFLRHLGKKYTFKGKMSLSTYGRGGQEAATGAPPERSLEAATGHRDAHMEAAEGDWKIVNTGWTWGGRRTTQDIDPF